MKSSINLLQWGYFNTHYKILIILSLMSNIIKDLYHVVMNYYAITLLRYYAITLLRYYAIT